MGMRNGIVCQSDLIKIYPFTVDLLLLILMSDRDSDSEETKLEVGKAKCNLKILGNYFLLKHCVQNSMWLRFQ